MSEGSFTKVNSQSIKHKLVEGLGFELRTLLNGFAGPLQLLKSRVDDPELVDIFGMLDSSLSRLERLTLRSSLIIGIDSESFTFQKHTINIIDAVKYSVLELQNISELENVSINVKSIHPDITVEGNLDLLIQVFDVLIETVISLSALNSSIEINFNANLSEIVCSITSVTANIPAELGSTLECHEAYPNSSWDLLMVHKLLMLHQAYIKIINNNGEANTIEVRFKKHAA